MKSTGEDRACIPLGQFYKGKRWFDHQLSKVCLKSHKNSRLDAAIQFMLEHVQESARWSGNFFFFMHLYPYDPRDWLIISKYTITLKFFLLWWS